VKYILMVYLLLAPLFCFSAVYLNQDKNGNTVYTDTPSTNATKISIPEAGSVSAPSPTQPSQPKDNANLPQKISKKPYTIFSISSPLDQETIQNQPTITVSIKIEPELQPGDKIQLFVDGKPSGDPAEKSSFVLKHIDRGKHELYATLMEDHQVTKRTNSIIIFVHYASVSVNQP
jgi:hypothetical protein